MATFAFTRKLGLAAAAGVTTLLLSSCAPTVATRGNLVDDDRLAQVQPGVSTMDEVATTLGSPSTVATFDQNTWYYIGQRTEKRAFFDPKIVDRRIIEVKFDATGVVSEIQELDLDAAQDVELVERETPTLGKQITFFEQMLGNFGRGMGRVEGRQSAGRTPRIPGR